MKATAEPTDEDLMVAYQRGDFDAFRRLYLRYEKRIYNFLLKYTGDINTANDLFQDVFVKVHRARDRFEPRYSFAPWIFTIAANTLKNEYVRKHRYQRVFSRQPEYIGEEYLPWTPEDYNLENNPHLVLELNQFQEIIFDALNQLPDSQRIAIILSKYLGFSYEEIAQITDASLGSVKQKIHRGFVTLKKILRDFL